LTPLPDIQEEARRIVGAAGERRTILRLIGGVAIALRCPSTREGRLRRAYQDLDLVGHERQSKEIKEILLSSGYRARERFNAVMGRRRMMFDDPSNNRRVDVFLDVFEMSHKLDFTARLELEPLTLTLADLLATKLQIVEVNEKDMRDVAALFIDHDVGSADGDSINGPYLAGLCSRDWGLYKTVTVNLAEFQNSSDVLGLTQAEMETSKARSQTLSKQIEAAPKSLSWRLRAGVGERVRWYELPEEGEATLVG